MIFIEMFINITIEKMNLLEQALINSIIHPYVLGYSEKVIRE